MRYHNIVETKFASFAKFLRKGVLWGQSYMKVFKRTTTSKKIGSHELMMKRFNPIYHYCQEYKIESDDKNYTKGINKYKK